MSNTWHRGHRAARRADRRRRRNWIVVAVVGGLVVLALGGFAAATVLADHGDAEVTTTAATSPPTRAPVAVAGTTASTTAALPCRADLTPDAPLRLWIAGDSIAYSVGNGLGKKAASTGVVAPVYESRVSSGLANPGFFDWPGRVDEELPRLDPEVVVFVMGTNDWAVPQATPVDASGAPAWRAAYAQKVADMVAALTADGRTLYWVGPPVLKDTKEEAGVRDVADVIRDVVGRSANAEFVDAHALLADSDGAYTANLEVDGKKVTVRAGDGVHLTPEGADYLGAAVFDRLDAQCRIAEQAVAGVTQPLVETRGSTSVAPGAATTAPPATSAATAPATTAPTAAPVPETTPTDTATPATTVPVTPTAPGDGSSRTARPE